MELAGGMDDVIHLEVGDPNFDTPPHIVEAAAEAARQGYTHYTPNAGLVSLREAIVEKLRRDNQINVAIENVIVTPGAVTAAMTSLMALVEPGDEVLLPDPCWPNNLMQVRLLGGRPVRYQLSPDRGFLPGFDKMDRLVSPATKVIVVNSPSNPTGAVWTKEDYADLLAFARRHDLYILSDEVYEAIVFDEPHVSPAAMDKDGRVVSVFGFSKSYAMTGWRLGYAVAPEPLATSLRKLQEPLVSCASAVSQKAAEAALLGPQVAVREMRDAYRTRRDEVLRLLKDVGCYEYSPRGAFYLLLNVSPLGRDPHFVARSLLEELRVATAPGITFGSMTRDYVRISLASELEDLLEGTRRICRFVYG